MMLSGLHKWLGKVVHLPGFQRDEVPPAEEASNQETEDEELPEACDEWGDED